MSSDLPLLSYLGTFQFLTNARDTISEGVKQVVVSKQYGAHLTSKFSGQTLCSRSLACFNGSLLLPVQNI